jgi:hypothetical protein
MGLHGDSSRLYTALTLAVLAGEGVHPWTRRGPSAAFRKTHPTIAMRPRPRLLISVLQELYL